MLIFDVKVPSQNVPELWRQRDDLREKGMFQDVDIKIQVRTYLNFDVNVLKHAFFPWIITYIRNKDNFSMTSITFLGCYDEALKYLLELVGTTKYKQVSVYLFSNCYGSQYVTDHIHKTWH